MRLSNTPTGHNTRLFVVVAHFLREYYTYCSTLCKALGNGKTSHMCIWKELPFLSLYSLANIINENDSSYL